MLDLLLTLILLASVLLNIGQGIKIKYLEEKIVQLTKILISRGWFN